METQLMDGTENECKIYLESHGIDVNSNLIFWGHKHLIQVSDIDRFNQIAQVSRVKQIRDDSYLTFYIRYENNPWTIALTDRREEFLIKYGANYQII